MTNKEISRSFRLLGKLMEMQGENPFKIRSYETAAGLLSKLGTPLSEMSQDEIQSLKGVGSAISGKIQELLTVGKMKTLERYKDQVPEGIQEMLQIKGLGAKKIKTAWEDLGVENATELLYACNENRLIELKGFGEKTQEEIGKQLEFFLSNRSNFLYANIEHIAEVLLKDLRDLQPEIRWEKTGDLRRQEPILDKLEYLMEYRDQWPDFGHLDGLIASEVTDDIWNGVIGEQTKVVIYRASMGSYEDNWLRTTGPLSLVNLLKDTKYESEKVAFEELSYSCLPPECRTHQIGKRQLPGSLVVEDDIKESSIVTPFLVMESIA
ncbi:MAG: hypothetical protein IPL46_16265 [Saprospiraceae bacterium]|nr:hypothetical protein [Saprospiraceae bacterium]